MRRPVLSVLLAILSLCHAVAVQPGYGQAWGSKQERRAADTKSRVEGLGVGALVAVTLESEAKFQGQITEIQDGSFKLMECGSSRLISYRAASRVGLVHPNYRADGVIDPVRVRQSVVNLGVGKNALVRSQNSRFKGKIESIGKENFTLRASGVPQTLKFSDVTEVRRKDFPAWGVGAIAAGVVVGVMMGVMLAACGTGGC
jgi:hypothetical protein